ncbi:MAG: hypothetical protein OEV89_00655 [Desulfobulbaceae bacterium]|nr:hypothetical protein [Desulfobulbaceae bacterium]HIJ89353.1 hypothetical protein [Deltaproteobacteria bacterium]
MNIPTQFGQGPAPCTDYQSLHGARTGKSSFAQTIAQTQSSCLSLTTAEGDQVTLSNLSQSYQYTQGVGWFSPTSSEVNLAGSSTTAEAMGLSVQGDLNEQELADINKLVGELTSIASAFFSGDHESAMTKAMDFGNLSLGSVSSLSASFSRQTVTQTRITSHPPLPAMTDRNDLNLQDLYEKLGRDSSEQLDYAELLKTRWQQILKSLDEMKDKDLDGLFARRMEPQPMPSQELPAEVVGELQAPASDPAPAIREAKTTDPTVPAEERAARQMLAHMEQLLSNHPKLSPFAGPLASRAMEKAASRSEQDRPETARAFGALRDAFRNQLYQWFLPPQMPTGTEPLTTA